MPVSKNRRGKRKAHKGRRGKPVRLASPSTPPATEADFEARRSAALKQALSFLPPGSVRHQLKFSIRLGRKELEIDGTAGATALGRLDILLTYQDRPLAVLELKRPGQPLDDDDRRQGLSYGRLLEPMAPLVIVSNGTATRIFQTHDGAAWQPDGESGASLKRLIENAARIAAQDVQEAVSTLLGPNSGAARDILRNLSTGAIRQLSGAWDESLLPFGDGLMFPRKAVMMILRLLDQGGRSVLVSGPPLVGKSNVLEQLALGYLVRADAVVLFVNGGSARQGLFRLLADAFSVELGWNIGEGEARQWLRDLSHRGPFRVILAIDDADPDLMGAEIDGFASDAFGGRVQLVISCSTGTLEKFTNHVMGDSLHHSAGKRPNCSLGYWMTTNSGWQ
jgi:hypothetical protein